MLFCDIIMHLHCATPSRKVRPCIRRTIVVHSNTWRKSEKEMVWSTVAHGFSRRSRHVYKSHKWAWILERMIRIYFGGYRAIDPYITPMKGYRTIGIGMCPSHLETTMSGRLKAPRKAAMQVLTSIPRLKHAPQWNFSKSFLQGDTNDDITPLDTCEFNPRNRRSVRIF